jgi:hypothetical protein
VRDDGIVAHGGSPAAVIYIWTGQRPFDERCRTDP